MRMSSPPKVKTTSPGGVTNTPRLNNAGRAKPMPMPNNITKPSMTAPISMTAPMSPMSRRMSPNKPRTMPNGSKSMPMKNSAY